MSTDETEYSADRAWASERRKCPVEGCEKEVEFAVSVWWTLFDFIDDESCEDHLRGTVNYWNARVVDGHDPTIDVERYDDLSDYSVDHPTDA